MNIHFSFKSVTLVTAVRLYKYLKKEKSQLIRDFSFIN
jgi:hypothetical protein